LQDFQAGIKIPVDFQELWEPQNYPGNITSLTLCNGKLSS